MKYKKLEIPFPNKNYRKQLELINFLEREEINYIISENKVDTIIISMDDIIFRGQRIICVLTSMINTINEKIIYDYNKYDPLLCFGISREYFVFVSSDKNEFYVNEKVLNFYLSESRPSNSKDVLIRPLYSKNNSTDYFYRVGALNTNILKGINLFRRIYNNDGMYLIRNEGIINSFLSGVFKTNPKLEESILKDYTSVLSMIKINEIPIK